jgi:tetratricopeptide (TPR) repeat protein
MAGEPSDWPDATRSLLRVPELERIERDARQLLSRALNGSRVIGFVGAGTSMAYGRLSWRDLVRIKQEEVLKRAKEYPEDQNVKRLKDLLIQQQITADGTSEPDAFPSAFQLTEQLHDLINRQQSKDQNGKPPTFREEVAKLLEDDKGQLHHILTVGLDGQGVPPVAALDETSCPNIRKAQFVRGLCAKVKDQYINNEPIINFVAKIEALVPEGQTFTHPYHRFVIAILLVLLEQCDREEVFSSLLEMTPVSGNKAEDPLRAALYPKERDPLHLMRELKISRFLTTNYDKEVEKLLRMEGLQPLSDGQMVDGDEPERADPLAPGSRDLIFDSEQTGQLFAFAAHTRRREATVVHLHGRTDRPESLIVTEGDYQRLYLAEHGNRGLMDDSLRTVFASSPLLFVGSGLGEDDLIRPLRQFVRDPSIGQGRVAIALVPMEHADQKKRQRAAIRNLQRYGVHTVHYGYVSADPTQPDEEERWLGPFIEYLRDIGKVIQKLLGEELPGDKTAKLQAQLNEQLDKLVRKIEALPGGSAPQVLEGVEVALHPGLDIQGETELLKALVTFVRDKHTQFRTQKGVADAIALSLNGIQDAVTGAFLCARLIRVHHDWEDWRDRWLSVPKPEEPRRAIERWKGANQSQQLPFRRHHVRLPKFKDIDDAQKWFKRRTNPQEYRQAKKSRKLSSLSTEDEKKAKFRQLHKLLRQRFDARAYSPTFLSLHKAMERNADSLKSLPRGRRLFLLVAHRGVGKGHFTTALAEDDYLKIFLKNLGDQNAETPEERWPSAIFNLSFSHEVSSTFDQLAAFLEESGTALGGDDFKATADLAKRLQGDRLNRLEALLHGWGETAKAGHFNGKRAVVVFNRFASLFDPAGHAKNAQTARLFELLTGKASQHAPIDLVLICSDLSIPLKFRRSEKADPASEQIKFHELREDTLSEGAKIRLDRRIKEFPTTELFSQDFIHLMRPARAILLATSYFPSVAMAIALSQSRTSPNGQLDHADLREVFSAKSAYELRMNVRTTLKEETRNAISARESFPVLLAAAAWRQQNGSTWTDLPGELLTLRSGADKPNEQVFIEELRKLKISNPEEALKHSKLIDEEFRSLFEACGNRRFAFTLLMACAYQYLLPIAEAPPDGTSDGNAMRRAFEQSIDFLKQMRLTLEGLPHGRREDLLLERILDAYRGMHETPNFPLPGGLISIKMGMPLFDLMQTILWHLSVIGQPVVTDALLEIPEIEKAAEKAAKESPPDDAEERRIHLRHVLVDALFLLEFRCLLFELDSSYLNLAPKDKLEDDGQRRWAVHRLVQRHAFLTLRAPYVDYASTDRFALTLINSMPNEVPRLTATAYRRLVSLVASLSAYPEPETIQVSHSVWLDNSVTFANIRARSQLLRAALGVVRAALSIPTLLRLDTREPDPSPLPLSHDSPVQRGVLEEHRLMLRWLLDQAEKLSPSIDTLGEDEQKSITRPFYAEEIVWLLNEIATLSFIQGHVADAVATYNRADEAARTLLEPVEDSPLRRRIALNRANADIARGRLRQAEAALRSLVRADDEHPAIRPIAQGLIGLVQHLRGRKKEAISDYEHAAGALDSLRRSRATAIVLRHHGDMLRSTRKFPEARLILDQAYTFAVEGNHEDIRHLIALSLIRLDLLDPEVRGSGADIRQQQHRRLDEADNYGRKMGMAALQCEVAFIRTWLQIRDGDLKSAASVAAGGLTLASANDMQIRTTSLLLLLCEIYVKREQYASAQSLLDAALRLANATEYHSAHQRAAQLLARISSGNGQL